MDSNFLKLIISYVVRHTNGSRVKSKACDPGKKCVFSRGSRYTSRQFITKTSQESITMTSTYDEKNSDTSENSSNENTNNNRSILSMQDLVILQANNIFPQNSKDHFKAYKHLHGNDMQIHSIPKPPTQKAHNMGLSDLHEEEFKLFAMEYNITNDEPHNELDHYVNTLQ
jgi:hypothetical protein